jgi:hypothetical protein
MRVTCLFSRCFAGTIAWAAALMLAVNGCGAHVMPPPQVPEKTVPQLAMPGEPPEADEGQVVIDTTNGPATVQVSLLGMWTHPLCATTPCAANLPLGTFNLIFKGRTDPALQSSEIVQVGRAPSILRHTMGSARTSPGLYLGGMGLLIAGIVVGGIGLMALGDSSGFIPKNSAYVSLGVGAAAMGVGGWMMLEGRPEITPGSSVQWAPGGAAPAPASTKGDKQQVLRVTPTGIAVSFN